MELNTISPNPGSKRNRKRRGRGIASGIGKTGGRGVKGQKSRSGGNIRPGFEGGQMPLQMRVPKFGFTSRKKRVTAQVCLSELNKLNATDITLDILKLAQIVPLRTRYVKVILSGEITKPVNLTGMRVTKGARAAIEAAGGTIKDAE
jgi:large subunit ribosomal protein L15